MSSTRDNLPPPPPPPETTMSPPNGIPAHVMKQNHSRSNSPHSQQGTPEPVQDLPPPPPVPKQTSPPKQQTPTVVQAPPPPPPPPMPAMTNGPTSPPALLNGDLERILSNSPPKLTPAKDRILPKQVSLNFCVIFMLIIAI